MADTAELQREAQRRLRRGEAEQAFGLYVQLLGEVDAPPATYDAWLDGAERAASRLPEPRLAAALALYRIDGSAARKLLPRDRFPVELAHFLIYTRGFETDALVAEAAELFEGAGKLV